MSNPERSTFQQCALASGLLSQRQLDEARSSVRWSEGDEPEPNAPPSDRQLAERLVEMRLLNAWQAKQLLDGRTKFNLGPYSIIDSIGQGGDGPGVQGAARQDGAHRGGQGAAARQVDAGGHRQFHPRDPRAGHASTTPSWSRRSMPARTETSTIWSRNTCPAWICGS